MDKFFGDPMMSANNSMQSSKGYEFDGSLNARYSPSAFNDNGIHGNENGKPYDTPADTEGLFTNPSLDGQLLLDPSEMRKKGEAFHE
ncbi:Hypothetical predicted protein [Olea europaea subsp. europaea]|uniref:Uncharacterized protein n=1 Tax=Olea europaea subsp. europaea TaxID=158383 RepID=A0A8S0UKJ2_OLEEU|nr:Hypothetical predicted protein [Olea europaea subsp. europaea]